MTQDSDIKGSERDGQRDRMGEKCRTKKLTSNTKKRNEKILEEKRIPGRKNDRTNELTNESPAIVCSFVMERQCCYAKGKVKEQK